jgi:hypothetical protein
MTEDNKSFTLVGEPSESPSESSTTASSAPSADEGQPASGSDTDGRQDPPTDAEHAQTQLPAIDFATFVISLNQSALVHMGVVADPGSGKRAKNLPLAKQTIDILGMLETKTQGNLNEDESKLLQSLLYDLRIIYVRQTD